MAAPVKVARQQTTPELCRTFRTLPPEPTPTRAGTLQNPPEPSETFRKQPFGTFWNQPFGTFRNLPPEPSPAYAGTSEIFRNLPPEPTPFYTGTLRNLPKPASGTYTSTRRNSPEPSGTFRNLPPEPAPATRTGTHQSLSGLKTPLAYAVRGKNQIFFVEIMLKDLHP